MAIDTKGLKNMQVTFRQMSEAISSHIEDAEREGITDLTALDYVSMAIEDAQDGLKKFLSILDGDGAP